AGRRPRCSPTATPDPPARGDGPSTKRATTPWVPQPHARPDGPLSASVECYLYARAPRTWGWTEHETVDEPVGARAPRTWGWTAVGLGRVLPLRPSPTPVGLDRARNGRRTRGCPSPTHVGVDRE